MLWDFMDSTVSAITENATSEQSIKAWVEYKGILLLLVIGIFLAYKSNNSLVTSRPFLFGAQ